MSKTTTNFGLIKPELTDPADITQTNQNWDKLDIELAKAQSKDAVIIEYNTISFDEVYNLINNGTIVYCRKDEHIMSVETCKSYIIVFSYIDFKNDFGGTVYRAFLATFPEMDMDTVWEFHAKELCEHLYKYGTEELVVGESNLQTGYLHFVYE